MDGPLRDEAAQDRVRSATEFLDPSKLSFICMVDGANLLFQTMPAHGGWSTLIAYDASLTRLVIEPILL